LFINKGGVSVTFRLGKLSLCFVNVHLTPHRKHQKALRRNQNIVQLMNRLVPDSSLTGGGNEIDLSSRHHFMFFFGDLNYRIDDRFDKHEAQRMLDAGEFRALVNSRDQLRQFRNEREVLYGFREAPIAFPPTYKLRNGTLEYSGKRLAGWCDRVLAKTRGDSCVMYQHSYDSVRDVLVSDHLPVNSIYSIGISPRVHLTTPGAQNTKTWLIEFASITLTATAPDSVTPERLIGKFYGECLVPSSIPETSVAVRSGSNGFAWKGEDDLPVLTSFGKYDQRPELEMSCIYLVIHDVDLFGEDDIVGHAVIELFDMFGEEKNEQFHQFSIPLTRSTKWTGKVQGSMRIKAGEKY